MHPFERKVLTLCRDNGLFSQGDRLVIGVSGGPDSMALLHVLTRLASDLGISMIVAHVDHGLRPLAAKEEENLVQRAAASLGLECQVGHLEVAAHAKGHGSSIEEAARDLRYEFFEAIAKDHDANKIAVAHTADDQAEEVLLRLVRGAGRKGLAGMTLLREGRVVRPFLTTEKAEVLSYLQERKIAFVHDSSNTDRRYLRNKIRLDLLPYLAQYNSNIKQTLRQTASILRDEDAFLDDYVEHDYALLVHEGVAAAGGPTASLTCAQFNQRPLAIRRRLLEKMLIRLGLKPGYRQIDGLISLATAKGKGQLHLKNGLRALTEFGEMRLFYPCGREARRGNLVEDTRPFNLVVPQPGQYLIPEIGKEIIVEIIAAVPSPEELKHENTVFFDAEVVVFPLLIRNRRPGDRFHPMHSKGRKNVADFLTDLKVPEAQRNKLPIVLSSNRIVAVLGGRCDQVAKVTRSTVSVLKVSMREA